MTEFACDSDFQVTRFFTNMRNEPCFLHFLRTGELGPLNFSLSLEEVYSKVGRPEHISRPFAYMGKEHDKQIHIYYKSLVIAFIEGGLVQFSFYFNQKEKGLPKTLNTPWYSAIKKKRLYFFRRLFEEA